MIFSVADGIMESLVDGFANLSHGQKTASCNPIHNRMVALSQVLSQLVEAQKENNKGQMDLFDKCHPLIGGVWVRREDVAKLAMEIAEFPSKGFVGDDEESFKDLRRDYTQRLT
jgi:hypothetical protein